MISLSIFISMLFSYHSPTVDTIPFQPNRPTKIAMDLYLEDSFIRDVRQTVSTAFNLYFSHCVSHDEYRPLTHSCKDTYGFSSTLLESLETLSLLNLTNDLSKAKSWLQSNFHCENIGWVNHHSFFSRAIASFEGAYILTGDRFFLTQAESCASRSISIDSHFTFPPTFINLLTGEYKSRIWSNGTSLSDIAAALPELIALSSLTNNATYHRIARSHLKHLPRHSSLFPDLYTDSATSSLSGLDALTMGFYRNLAIAFSLKPDRIIQTIIETTMNSFNLWPDENVSMYAPLIDAQSALGSLREQSIIPNRKNINFNFKGDSMIMNELKDQLSYPFSVFNTGSENNIGGFRYDGSILRVLLREAINGNEDSKKMMIQLWNKTKEKLMTEDGGFSGILHTNNKKFKLDNVMHESFFCQWVIPFALLSKGYTQMASTIIFNERGHILSCEEIIPKICL